jgi:hypothetical protein
LRRTKLSTSDDSRLLVGPGIVSIDGDGERHRAHLAVRICDSHQTTTLEYECAPTAVGRPRDKCWFLQATDNWRKDQVGTGNDTRVQVAMHPPRGHRCATDRQRAESNQANEYQLARTHDLLADTSKRYTSIPARDPTDVQ